MPGATRTRSNEIQAAARELVAAVWPMIDSMEGDARRSVLVGLYKQLQTEQGVVRDTARSHIVKALRIARGQSMKPDGWGGNREAHKEGE